MRRWLSVLEASEYFGIPQKTLYSLIGRDLLPGGKGAVLRFGRAIRIDVNAVEMQPAEKERKR